MEAARLLARGELDETQADTSDPDQHLREAAQAFGLVVEGVAAAPENRYYLWPENLEAWRFFRAAETQWRHGFNGPTGLDYPGVQIVMDGARIPARRQREMWRFVWAMERGALTGWAEARAERARD